MRRSLKTLVAASALAGGLAGAPALYAHDSEGTGGSMMGQGMKGQGGMMGMMNMMRQMNEMMESCNEMMMRSTKHDGPGQPNERRPKDAPKTDGTSNGND